MKKVECAKPAVKEKHVEGRTMKLEMTMRKEAKVEVLTWQPTLKDPMK